MKHEPRQTDPGARIDLAHETDFAIASLLVRPSAREVVDAGDRHVVEPRVMQVLVALARAEGAIVSRDDLISACWENRIVGEDAINRVIGRLRRLAEETRHVFRIETVTKVGYRLVRTSAASDPIRPQTPRARRRWLPALAAGAAILVAVAGAAWWHRGPSPSPSPTEAVRSEDGRLPADPKVAAQYLQARQDWAARRPDTIARAIREFAAVIARDPGYAPAYAGLADAYILSREFGALRDGDAFPKAKASAEVAAKIDPDLAGAQRALGFILYWWDHDPAGAGRAFRRAIALAPTDAQSHFWYANILADNGEFDAATREFDAARAINPESTALQTDWAWALWSAGDRDRAMRELTAIGHDNPDLATPHDCLRVIYLAEHDYRRYVDEYAIVARLRQSSALIGRVRAQQDALVAGPDAFKRVLLHDAVVPGALADDDPAWPAFVASTIGDRAALMDILQTADRRNLKWGSAGEVARIARAWPNDSDLQRLLARRKAPSIA